MVSISIALVVFMKLSITVGAHYTPPEDSSGSPSSVPISTIYTEENQNRTRNISLNLLSETPSSGSYLLSIEHLPSETPSFISFLSPSSSPSMEPTNQPLTNFPSSIPSLTPSWTKSSFPSKSPSRMPSQTPSRKQSMVPSILPSSFPSVKNTSMGPSSKPSTFLSSVTTIKAEFALQTSKALNETEIRMIEEFLKDCIVEMASQCFIEDVTLTSQRLDLIGARRLEIQKLIIDLNITGRLVQDHSDSKFALLVKRILFDEDGYLQSRLSVLPMFQEREWISSVSDVEGTPKPHSTIKLLIKVFLGVGAAVCGMALIAMIVFLVTRSKGSNSHASRDGQFIDQTQFPTEIDQELVTTEEEDNDTSTLSSALGFDNEVLDDRDFAPSSTFSYSGTSCDSGKDFMMSLTSSSVAASELKGEFLASNLCTIPLQDKRHASIDDEDMQDISIVETEIDNSELKSKKSFPWAFTKHQSRNNFAQSDITPKLSTFVPSQKEMTRALSTVSSLSDKSSYVGSASLNGTPYEVLVAGNKPLGLIIKSTSTGPQILRVKSESPVHGIVDEGDYIISVDGKDTRSMSAKELSQWLHREVNIHGKERTFILMNSNHIEENWLKMAKSV